MEMFNFVFPFMPGSLTDQQPIKSLERVLNEAQEARSFPSTIDSPQYPEETRKALVLDLDETLIHTSNFPAHKDVKALHFPDWDQYVFLRPDLMDFLDLVTSMYEVYVFTAGTKEYADRILDQVCPQIDHEHRFYREQCKIRSRKTEKDLTKFKRPLSQVIMVDDNGHMKDKYPENTIHISKWNGTPNDNVLMNEIFPILKECENADDVRPLVKKTEKKLRRQSSFMIE